MKGGDLGVRSDGSALPCARVTLWVRTKDERQPPPELHGQRLRSYVRKAGIESTGWRLLRGAHAYGTYLRKGKRRWRRHVVFIGLHDESVQWFTSLPDGGEGQ